MRTMKYPVYKFIFLVKYNQGFFKKTGQEEE